MRKSCLLHLLDWLPGPPERHEGGPRAPAWYAAGEALRNVLASAPSWALESRECGVELKHGHLRKKAVLLLVHQGAKVRLPSLQEGGTCLRPDAHSPPGV